MSSWLSLTFVVHILDSESPQLCPQCLSFHFPQSEKRPFLTVSAPGCHSLYLSFLTPVTYLYYSLFHVSLACLSFSKRQKQVAFSLGTSPKDSCRTQHTVDASHMLDCKKGNQSNSGNLLIVFRSPHKLYVSKPTYLLRNTQSYELLLDSPLSFLVSICNRKSNIWVRNWGKWFILRLMIQNESIWLIIIIYYVVLI